MSLQDDLKARAIALVSQQMANWVVDIQRQIADNQASFVKALDDLQESVARYDEKIDEAEIGRAMAEASAGATAGGGGGGGGADLAQLKQSMARIEAGNSLSEVLTHLVNEAASYVDRAAIFIVKGANAIGWYARNVTPPEAIKQLNIPLGADTLFKTVQSSRASLRAHISQAGSTGQVIARLGGRAGGILGVPLILRDKLAAVLYCDTTQQEVPQQAADAVETLVAFAGKTIDLISLTPKGQTPSKSALGNASGPIASATLNPQRNPLAGVASGPAPPEDEGASTVMFQPGQFAQLQQEAAAMAQSPEEQKAHEEAKRFARLVVSEIKLYNEAKVNEGRRNKDIYSRLKEDIERGRQMYTDRIQPNLRDSTSYFQDELVRILAGGDASALGRM
jgi:hypothetical protein